MIRLHCGCICARPVLPRRPTVRSLVVGMDGTVGSALHRTLRVRGDPVTGTSRRSSLPAGAVHLDLGAPEAANAALPTVLITMLNSTNHAMFVEAAVGSGAIAPEAANAALPTVDVAFFCAGMTRFADCREQPDVARRVNATAPAALAARLVQKGTRVVLLSTSAVLDCAVPHMSAERALSPASVYGIHKAQAESEFLALGPAAAVLRLTKVLTPDTRLFCGWIAALAGNERVRAFHDLRFSPIMLDQVVAALVEIADRGAAGVLQASGASDISYADAARHLARRLGAAVERVEACSAVESGIPGEEVTAYTSLDTGRLSKLCGFAAPEPLTVLDLVFGPSIEAALSRT